MVGDQRSHDDSLARPGRHFERNAREIILRRRRDLLRFFKPPVDVLADVGFLGDLVQPDSRFDGFALREKKRLGHVPFGVEKPELKQLAGDARRLWVFRLPPRANLPAEKIDDMCLVVCRCNLLQFH